MFKCPSVHDFCRHPVFGFKIKTINSVDHPVGKYLQQCIGYFQTLLIWYMCDLFIKISLR